MPGYEPEKANDGSFRSFWTVPAHNLPADLGVEWPEPQEISSLIVRFCDRANAAHVQFGPNPAIRTTSVLGRRQVETSEAQGQSRRERRSSATNFRPSKRSASACFSPSCLSFMDRIAPDQSGIDVSELEVYRKPPYQTIPAATRLMRSPGRRFAGDRAAADARLQRHAAAHAHRGREPLGADAVQREIFRTGSGFAGKWFSSTRPFHRQRS